MAGRKQKSVLERLRDVTAQLQKEEARLARCQAKVMEYQQRDVLLSHVVVGELEEWRLPFPEVESVLTQLEKRESTEKQTAIFEEGKTAEAPSDKRVQLILRVTEGEKAAIQANMRKAHYTRFNSYARKLLLDGYLILWTSPETRALKKELGAVNRSLNQLVKRANVTGSIYAGDFQDILCCWQKIQKTTLHYIDQMNRKSHGLH